MNRPNERGARRGRSVLVGSGLYKEGSIARYRSFAPHTSAIAAAAAILHRKLGLLKLG